MASVNKVILIGNLGRDPEVRYTPSGKAVANVTIATNEVWKDKNTGEKQERTEWHRVIFYSPQAEIVGQYLRKGSAVYVEGRLQTRKWQGQDGQERYTTEIIAQDMKMLGSKNDRMGGSVPYLEGPEDGYLPPAAKLPQNASFPSRPTPGTGFDKPADLDDDIPF